MENRPGYRKTPEWKVVPGQAFAIPAIPPSSGGVAEDRRSAQR